MNASSKIDRLLEITGTPPERREVARKNYSRLVQREGERALDTRLAEFEAMQGDIAVWREQRTQPLVAAKPLTAAAREASSLGSLLVREKLAARRLQERIDIVSTRLDRLLINKGSIEFDRINKMVRDAGLLLGLRQASQLDTTFTSASDIFGYFTRIYDAIAGRTQLDLMMSYANKIEDFLNQIEDGSAGSAAHLAVRSSRIDTDQAISGLGRMAAYVVGFVPDAIVTLNEGGAAIGTFIQTHLNLDIPIIALKGNSRGLTPLSGMSIPGSFARLLVIDDVARSGGTVSTAFAWIAQRYPDATLRAATIAASLDAIELIGEGVLVTPNPTDDPSVTLPYDPHAGFAVREQNDSRLYIFGADATAPKDRLVVPVEIVDKVVAEQERIFAGD